MKKIFVLFFALFSLTVAGQSSLTFSSTPDSANQTPRAGSTGTFQFTYSGNVFTNNNVYYSICCQSSKSSALNAYRFNFNIPSSATITGVSATYSTTGGNGGTMNYKWDSLCLINNFVKISGYKRDSVNGTNGTFTHGSSSDSWGAALTPAIVNSPHFGVRLHLDTYGINTTLLGGFKMVIFYDMPTGLKENTEAVSMPLIYPGNKELHVERSTLYPAKLMLYSLTGEKVSEIAIEGKEARMNLNELSPGIYIYRYCSDVQTISSRIVVE